MKIANAAGVPSTLACMAWTRDARCVLLTTWHALFGRGASWTDPIWLVAHGADARHSCIGRTLDGRIGTVRFDGDDYFVDCAIGTWAGGAVDAVPTVSGWTPAAAGTTVTKTGAITGVTRGVVVDTAFSTSAVVHGRTQRVLRQLLIRSTDDSRPFAAEGDSGALVVNDRNEAFALLWGATVRGEGVACPIGPVLRTLDITLAARVS